VVDQVLDHLAQRGLTGRAGERRELVYPTEPTVSLRVNMGAHLLFQLRPARLHGGKVRKCAGLAERGGRHAVPS